MLWAAEAAHMRLVMGAKGANPMARLASPQLFLAPWWWWRDSLCPGMSSTPPDTPLWMTAVWGLYEYEYEQYEARERAQFGSETTCLLGTNNGFERGGTRKRVTRKMCFPAFCQSFRKTMKQVGIVIGSVGHLLLSVLYNNFSVPLE